MNERATRRIIEAAEGTRRLTADELASVMRHVAQAGFDPRALEQVRGSLAGLPWQGRVLQGSDRLPPLVRHYLRHVVQQEQWPPGTTIGDYAATIGQVVADPAAYSRVAIRDRGSWESYGSLDRCAVREDRSGFW